MDQEQRHHEHRRERDVLGVEERVRIQPRMQHEDEQRERRQQPAAEQPVGQQVAEQAAGEEEEMRQEMPNKMDMAYVLKRENMLGEVERNLERNAVMPDPIGEQPLGSAQSIVGSIPTESSLISFVRGHAVVVENA